jgi:hypothetical protein
MASITMNHTNFEHAFVALIFTLIGWVLGSVEVGAAFTIGVFAGREHAQREYRIGDPSKLIGYEALDFWRWSLDAKLDLLFPVLTALAFVYILR